MERSSARPAVAGHPASAFAAISALIVDDEPHVSAYLRMLLRSLGVTAIWEAAGGELALELYRQHRPSVMLLDVSMPGMSGDEVLRELMAIDPDAAVVVVTSQNDHEIVQRFAQLGAMGYVLKYLPKEQVCRALAEAMEPLLAGNDETA